MGNTIQIDGHAVAIGTATAFKQMAAEFKRVWGVDLLVSDGLRELEKQRKLYNAWIAYKNGRGPWAPLAAAPDPNAPHVRGAALDLRDSGSDAGVAKGWNPRANWLRENCHRWGFKATGYGFSSVEPWHYEYQGNAWAGSPNGDSSNVGRNATSRPTVDIQRLVGADPDGIYGPGTTAKVAEWQLRAGLEPDGVWGPLSDAKGFAANSAPGSLVVDGNWGENTTRKLQERLGVKVDGQFGPQSISALQAALGVNVDGQFGPQTISALQKAIGAHVDGQSGTETATKLQQFLNSGQHFSKVGIQDPAPATGTAPKPVDPPVTERTPTYPGAARAFNVPLGDGVRNPGSVINKLIVHHTATTADQAGYFSVRNERSSCPTFYVRTSGEVIEFIEPSRRPAATGSANTYSIAIETQNTSADPAWGISDAAHEAIAKIAAWLSGITTLGGFTVDIDLDRLHVIGHNEAGVNATACPGPSMDLDRIVRRAKELVAPIVTQPQPQPEPEPHPQPEPEPQPEPPVIPEPQPEPAPEPPKEFPVPTVNTDLASDAAKRLGNILPQRARDAVYIGYGAVGIAFTAIVNYLSATQNLAPEWLVGGISSYASVGVFVAILAKANPTEKKA
ncbi:MAG: 20, gp20 [Microbacterium sp.]|jgi:peptidoglycan hydrolase-like protein with peptidoglycan-binding domain|nr:20, gp20 [Microbacterium sp.]